MSIIQRIDHALELYYNYLDIIYKNDDNFGKFAAFCKDKFNNDVDEIVKEINCKPNDCMLVTFDSNFPLHPPLTHQQKRNKIIHRIIKHCYTHGVPPNNVSSVQHKDKMWICDICLYNDIIITETENKSIDCECCTSIKPNKSSIEMKENNEQIDELASLVLNFFNKRAGKEFDNKIFSELMQLIQYDTNALSQIRYKNYSIDLHKKDYDNILTSFIGWIATVKCDNIQCNNKLKLLCSCDPNTSFQRCVYYVILSIMALKSSAAKKLLNQLSDANRTIVSISSKFTDRLLHKLKSEDYFETLGKKHIIAWVSFELYNFQCNTCGHINKSITIDRIFEYAIHLNHCRVCHCQRSSKNENVVDFSVSAKNKKAQNINSELVKSNFQNVQYEYSPLIRYDILKPKYGSLAEEIALNSIVSIPMQSYLEKAKTLHLQMKTSEYVITTKENREFGLSSNETIGIGHVMAICISVENPHFMQQFIKYYNVENINELCRNWYWFGRYFYEVGCFFSFRINDDEKQQTVLLQTLNNGKWKCDYCTYNNVSLMINGLWTKCSLKNNCRLCGKVRKEFNDEHKTSDTLQHYDKKSASAFTDYLIKQIDSINDTALNKYKHEIMQYFKENNIYYDKLNNMTRKEFMNNICLYCNNKKLKAKLAKLYKAMKAYNETDNVSESQKIHQNIPNDHSNEISAENDIGYKQLIRKLQDIQNEQCLFGITSVNQLSVEQFVYLLDRYIFAKIKHKTMNENNKHMIMSYFQEMNISGDMFLETMKKNRMNLRKRIADYCNNKKLSAVLNQLFNAITRFDFESVHKTVSNAVTYQQLLNHCPSTKRLCYINTYFETETLKAKNNGLYAFNMKQLLSSLTNYGVVELLNDIEHVIDHNPIDAMECTENQCVHWKRSLRNEIEYNDVNAAKQLFSCDTTQDFIYIDILDRVHILLKHLHELPEINHNKMKHITVNYETEYFLSKPIYSHLYEEVTSRSQYLAAHQFESQLEHVKILMKSNKNILKWKSFKTDKKYAIEKGDLIRMEHIFSIILYCNFSSLKNAYQHRQDVVISKSSADKLYFFGRFLANAVQFYGEIVKKEQVVYASFARKRLFNSFMVVYEKPTSITSDQSVLENIDAICLKLSPKYNNQINISGYIDVSNVLNFRKQKEILFAGKMVMSIIDIYQETGNLKDYIQSILYLERIIEQTLNTKNAYNHGVLNANKQKKYLVPLLRHQITRHLPTKYSKKQLNQQNKINTYALQLFEHFCDKQRNCIDLSCIMFEQKRMDSTLSEILFKTSNTQLIINDLAIAAIFPNVKQFKNQNNEWITLSKEQFKEPPKKSILKIIDTALGRFYQSKGRNNYFDKREWKGKFQRYCEENGYDDDNDLNDALKAKDSLLILDDEKELNIWCKDFPFPDNISDLKQKEEFIFRVLLKCKNNANAYITLPKVPSRLKMKRSITDMSKSTLVKKHTKHQLEMSQCVKKLHLDDPNIKRKKNSNYKKKKKGNKKKGHKKKGDKKKHIKMKKNDEKIKKTKTMFQNQSQMIQNVSGVSLRSSISDIGSPDIGCSIDDDGIYITPLSGIEEQGYGGNSIEITLTGLVHQKKMNYILIMSSNWSTIREVKQALPWLDTRTQCRVFWGGMELRDDDTLADCRIVPQSKVKIMITDTNTNKKDARQIEHKHMDIFNSIKQINNFELFSSLIDKTLKKTYGMQLRENVKHILHSYCKCLSHNKTYERKWSQLHTICYDYQGKLHDVERILRENNLYIDMWSPFGYDTPLRLAIAVNGNNTNLIDLVEFLLLNGARRMIRQTVDDLRNVHVMYPDMNRKIREELVALLKPYASQDPCKPWKC